MSDLDYPADLRYTSDHEWVADQGEGVVRVGVTDFAQDSLGDVVFVSLMQRRVLRTVLGQRVGTILQQYAHDIASLRCM